MSVWVATRGALGRGTRGGTALWRIGLVVGAIALVAWVLQQGITLDPEAIRAWLVGLGPLGPFVYMLLYTAQVVCAPVPGLPIGAAAGFAFGLVPATVYGMIGLTLGVVIATITGRIWGLRVLGRVAGADAIASWEQMRLINSPLTWLVVFLGPSPDLILFVAGMSRIPLRVLIPIGIVGRAPAMATATLLGAGFGDMGVWPLIAAAAIGLLFGCLGLFFKRLVPTAPVAQES
ncbi:MAG TPA: hypothetical protein VGM69_02565 [Chloroflexota bacterium]